MNLELMSSITVTLSNVNQRRVALFKDKVISYEKQILEEELKDCLGQLSFNEQMYLWYAFMQGDKLKLAVINKLSEKALTFLLMIIIYNDEFNIFFGNKKIAKEDIKEQTLKDVEEEKNCEKDYDEVERLLFALEKSARFSDCISWVN